jgi:hypothetical protein
MKTYPYMNGDQLIQLVEQRDYDELAEIALKLANALALITEEYEDRKFQFGDDPLWQKHEGENPLPTAFAALEAYEFSKGEQP